MARTLTPREHKTLLIGGAVIGVLVLFLVAGPLLQKRASLDSRLNAYQEQMAAVVQLQQTITAVQRGLQPMEKKLASGRQVELISFANDLVDRFAARDQLVALRPQPATRDNGLTVATLELKLQRLDLNQTLNMLQAAQQAPGVVVVRSLKLKSRFDDRSLLDADMVLALYTEESRS